MHPVARIKKTTLKRPSNTSSTKAKAASKPQTVTKFKIRCSRYLYTLVLPDAEKAEKLKQSLPPGEFLSGDMYREREVTGEVELVSSAPPHPSPRIQGDMLISYYQD